MNKSFITYYRDNKQLHTSKLNGFPFVSFGVPVGQINGATCFESVTITTGGKRERVVTADDFGGPVSICVETKGQPPQWFGLTGKTACKTVTPVASDTQAKANQVSSGQLVWTPADHHETGPSYVQEISA